MEELENIHEGKFYYAHIFDGKLDGKGQCPVIGDNAISVEISKEVYDDIERYIWNGSAIVLNPNYEQEQAQKERQRLDGLTLTPADVERALYKAKNMDFEDLKTFIAQQIPNIDIKALAIEFRAKDFYRGAEANGVRLFDTIGQLLGYNVPADMDYLFEHKELPTGE